MTTKKEHALFKITGSYGRDIGNGSCGKCNKSYGPEDLTEKEESLDGDVFKYRLIYECPKGHVVLGADV